MEERKNNEKSLHEIPSALAISLRFPNSHEAARHLSGSNQVGRFVRMSQGTKKYKDKDKNKIM